MNCTQFRKYAGAFADGELDIQINLEALEHLNMCPACTQRVDEIASLRSALERTHSNPRASRVLRDQIRNALEAQIQEPEPVEFDATMAASGQVGRPRHTSRWLVPLSMAAVLVAAVSAWQYVPTVDVSSGTMTTLAVRTVADVARIHRDCSRNRRSNHHNSALPENAVQLASELSRQLGFQVIVPDFTPSGFALVGADFCALGGRDTAHVLYAQQAEGGAALSVFSTKHIPELRPAGITVLGNTGVFVREVGELTVAAWHDNGQTYTFCSELAERSLLRTINQIRTAMRLPESSAMASLAIAASGLPR